MDWGPLAEIVAAVLTFVTAVVALYARAKDAESKALREERDSAEKESKALLGMLFILAQGTEDDRRKVMKRVALMLQGDQREGFFPGDE